MKALQCEMCGGNDLVKDNGLFVCQHCGMKYTLEEARKLMIEGVVDVSGSTVKIDNTAQIKNFIEMAESAYEAGNKAESEAYCNRVIEIEPKNCEAWFMKGRAASWQSTLANIRIEEGVQCFSKAINYSSEDKVSEVKSKIAKEISELSMALVSLACDSFKSNPSFDNVKRIDDCAVKTKEYSIALMRKCDISEESYIEPVAKMIEKTAIDMWNKVIKPHYEFDNDGHPSKTALLELYDKGEYCKLLLLSAIDYAPNAYFNNVQCYNDMIAINDYIIEACAYKQVYGYATQEDAKNASIYQACGNYSKDFRSWYWVVDCSINDYGRSKRNEENSQFRIKADDFRKLGQKKQREDNERQAKEQKERFDSYWAEHAEEKQKYEAERDTLNKELEQLKEQVAPYDNEINELKKKRESDTPSKAEKRKIEDKISAIRQEQSSLSLFKVKEKKALQAQIDELYSRGGALNDKIEKEEQEQTKLCNDKIKEIEQNAKPIKDKITELQKRIGEINNELTKNR